MNNTQKKYLVDIKVTCPPNYKKSILILGKYTLRDIFLIVFTSVWVIVWFVLLTFVFEPKLINLIVICVPLPIIVFTLIQPVNGYHNLLDYCILRIRYSLSTKYYSSLVSKKKKRGKKYDEVE